jgi:translocation and assembly module TamB
VLVLVTGLALLAVAAALVSFNTPQGRFLIEAVTEWATHGGVRLRGLAGRFPDHLRLGQLTISDPQGAWLRADGVILDWSPLQLIKGRLLIERATAQAIEVLRRPHYPARSARPSTGSPFRLPFTIQADRLDLPYVHLSAALAGHPVAARIEGNGSFRSLEEASLQLRAQRLDAVPSVYQLALQSDASLVKGELDLQEDAGGPLSNLILLPALGALAVHLDAAGAPSALATTLDARAGALRASAKGTIDLPALAAQLNLELESPAMAPRPGLSWQRASLRAHVQGPFVGATTSGQIELAGLEVGALQLDALQADLYGQGRGLALDATVNGLTLPGAFHSTFAHAPIRLKGEARLVSARGIDVDLSLAHPLISAQAHYEFGPAGSSVQAPPTGRSQAPSANGVRNNGTVLATLPDLAPWAQLAHLDLQGRGSLQAEVAVQGQATRVTLAATADLRGGEERWTRLLGPRVQIGAAVRMNPGQVQLERAQLTGNYLQASARGEDRDQQLNLTWQLALSNLSRLSAGTSGPLTAQGSVQGRMPRLNLTVDASSDITHGDTHGTLRAVLHAQDLPREPSGDLTVSGPLNNALLALSASLRSDNAKGATLTLERIDWRSAHAQGTLRVDGDLRAPQGELSLQLPRLQDLSAVIGESIQGSAAARVVFTRVGQEGRAQISVDAQQLALRSLQLKTLQIGGVVADPLRQPRLALKLTGVALVRGMQAALSAQANGGLNALELAAHANVTQPPADPGGAATASTLTVGGIWNEAQRQLKLTALAAQYRDQDLRLMAPALISMRDGITVDRLRLELPPAVIQVEGRVTPTLDLRASVRDFNPGAFGVVMPLVQAQGHTDIEAQLRGEMSRPTGTITLTAGGISAMSGAARGLPTAALKVVAQLADGGADVNATLSAGTRMQLQARGQVPLQRSGTMALRLSGTMDLAVADPVLEASGQRLSGQLTIEAQVAGTPASPQARGSMTITHGDVQDYQRGVHLTAVSLELAAEGSQLQLKQFTAHAGAGTLSADGSVDLGAPGMPMQLKLTAQNAEPLSTDLISANLNADLRVRGAVLRRELVASGTVRVNRATINIPNALPPDVASLQVVRAGQAAPPPPPKPMLASLALTIDAPRGIYVRGRGLSAEMGGTVRIGGSGETPLIGGGFDLINGIMDLSGATLTFQSGRVSFNGAGLRQKFIPTLDLVASSAIGGTTAKLEVGGYVDAPTITLTSTPPEPQDQILAQLLFGQNVSQLSAFQVAGIASALVTLTGAGGGGGLNPLGTVQKALGLNRLVISSNSQSGATTSTQNNTGVTIQAGRYVSNRVYVGAKQSTNGLTQAQVQVDLARQLKLLTTLSTGGGTVQGATPDNDPGSSVGISYTFQY